VEQVVVAEVLEKSGRVHERIRLTRFPATIGRGYSNDIILDDDFVSPHHAQIELNEDGRAVLVDLSSENGTYMLPKLQKTERLPLGPDTLLRLGHTLLRLRSPNYQVAKTRHDNLSAGRLSRWIAGGLGAALSMAIVMALLLIESHQTSDQTIRPEQLLLHVLPFALAIPVWAGLWALASRAFAHHTFYAAHIAIASLAVIGFYLLDTAAEYYAFGLSADLSADLIFEVAGALVGAAMFYGHLRFATLLAPRVLATVSVFLSATLVGLSLLTGYVESQEFSDDLPYPGELKPGMFKLSASHTPADFAAQAAQVAAALNSEPEPAPGAQ
jgi:hypothetical protein